MDWSFNCRDKGQIFQLSHIPFVHLEADAGRMEHHSGPSCSLIFWRLLQWMAQTNSYFGCWILHDIFNLNVRVVVELVSMIRRVWKVTRVGNVLSLNPVFKWPQADACREFDQKMFRKQHDYINIIVSWFAADFGSISHFHGCSNSIRSTFKAGQLWAAIIMFSPCIPQCILHLFNFPLRFIDWTLVPMRLATRFW